MQPPHDECHIAAQLPMGSLAVSAENTVAVGTRLQEDLLDKESCGIFQNVFRAPGYFDGFTNGVRLPGGNL
jgi:hypothetical protein